MTHKRIKEEVADVPTMLIKYVLMPGQVKSQYAYQRNIFNSHSYY